MEDVSIPGFYKHFFYEDFHPNVPEELKRQSRRFLEEVAGQCLDELYNGLNFQVRSKDGVINGDEACNRIREYYGRFDSIKLGLMDNFIVQIEEKQATVSFDICLHVSIPLNENITLEGKGNLGFANVMHDLWLIDSVSLPGLVL
jgi:predicted metalloprotease